MIPVFFGWGDKAKDVGYVGIEKCPHCKNYTHFVLKEIAKSFSLYFIPVAKWNRKVYLVCPICEACYELDEENKKLYFDRMYQSLDPERTSQLWEDAIQCFLDYINDNHPDFSDDKNLIQMLDNTFNNLKGRYGDSDYVRHIISQALICSVDEDKPK